MRGYITVGHATLRDKMEAIEKYALLARGDKIYLYIVNIDYKPIEMIKRFDSSEDLFEFLYSDNKMTFTLNDDFQLWKDKQLNNV